MRRVCLSLLLLLVPVSLVRASPLMPVKTETPRDTMMTFMEAMNDYRRGVVSKDPQLTQRIEAAVRTLNLSGIPVVVRGEKGREIAILLKEVIDRVILIDSSLIPNDPSRTDPWRLKDTEITIRKVQEGDREGAFLFTEDTVSRVGEFFSKVKHLDYLEGSGQGAQYQESWIEQRMPEWTKKQTFYLYHWQWMGIFLAILLGLLLKWLTEISIEFGKRLAVKTRHQWDDKAIDAVERPLGLIVATAFWFVALKVLRIDGVALDVLSVTIQVIFSIAVIWMFLNLTGLLTEFLKTWTTRREFPIDDQLIPLLNRAIRLFVVVFGVLVAIQNLGVNVMSLLAGLGLGGLAFALAAKDTAANLFGSIMILWDQPFKVGDWIVSEGAEGTVEEIGFRSTLIRTFYDSQISVPNSALANAHIDNMGRRKYRRITTTLGVTYDTPPERLESFIAGIKEIIKTHPHTRKDYYHVVLNGFGASSLDILLYAFVEVPDWTLELAEKQSVYLEIVRLAHKLGVSFAFPTQSLHIESFPGNGSAALPQA